jgi:hypothetical protein
MDDNDHDCPVLRVTAAGNKNERRNDAHYDSVGDARKILETIAPIPTTSITAIPAVAAWAAFLAWAGFAHLDLAVVDGVPVKLADRLGGFFRRVHFDEAKPFGTACLAVNNYGSIGYPTCLLKQGT